MAVVSKNLGSESIVGAGTYRGMSKGELKVRIASSAFSNQRRNVGCYMLAIRLVDFQTRTGLCRCSTYVLQLAAGTVTQESGNDFRMIAVRLFV